MYERTHSVRYIHCVCCGVYGPHTGRGLIDPCYKQHRRAGLLDRYPKQTRDRDEILTRWEALVTRSPGWTYAEYARELHTTRAALNQTLIRARRRGDPRAIYHTAVTTRT